MSEEVCRIAHVAGCDGECGERPATVPLYFVQICRIDTDEVVKQMGPMGERAAEKTERGVHINMNHEDYYTEIVPAKES